MGIVYHNAKMLYDARMRGVSFARTLTVGHLSLFLHPAEVRTLQKTFREGDPASSAQPLGDYCFGDNSDSFFAEFLGTTTLEILDNSAYEGATIVHDLNSPVPPELCGRFDAVVDAGTLEHVFNFPIAVSNLMQMTKVGGTLFIMVPANSLCGHGFYQFSPELVYRVFCADNGFSLRQVWFLKAKFPGIELARLQAYRVVDPAVVGQRVMLSSRRPVMIAIEATKTADIVPFSVAPQQSDYVVLWGGAKPVGLQGSQSPLRRLGMHIPAFLKRRLTGHLQRWRSSLSNRRFYKKLNADGR